MELKDVNWKKVKWLILIPILMIATIVYMIAGCHSQDITVSSGKNGAAVQNKDIDAEVSSTDSESDEMSSNNSKGDIEEYIYIDVGGAVVNPKVVKLKAGSRIYEAIEAAGGKSKTAETKYLNMAAVCEDGQKIYVPTSAEISPEDKQQAIVSSAGYSGETGTVGIGKDGKININNASSDDLQTLSGIGPSMASRIIQYREDNGKYTSIEDLLNVSGIGEKTLAKFADDICV